LLFSEVPFYVFFVLYFAIHLATPPRARLALIVVGSTIFYGWWSVTKFDGWWKWASIFLPHALMLLAWAGALWMNRAATAEGRRARMIAVVAALLAPLAVVKYADFLFRELVTPVFGLSGTIVGLSLPLGISFVTFTLIAYVVDVWRGLYKVEPRLGLLAGLVTYFPHLIAGPILRPHELMPQLERPHRFTRALKARVVFGLAIFSVGLVKKVVFADQVSEVVDKVYAVGATPTLVEYWLALYGFALQIYCDFSGYTDMAIGAALIIGVRLPTNFRSPYAAASIVDFWRRWHITLSNWLRDYLYIPLGGNRFGRGRQLLNLVITMALGGLWHGANWTFVVWGLLHGGAIALTHALRWSGGAGALARIPTWVKVLVTFHFVALVWIPFRAPDMATVGRVLRGLFEAPAGEVAAQLALYGFPVALLVAFFLTHRFDSHRNVRRAVVRLPRTVLWPLLGLMWLLAITISQGSSAKFIYFDF
jgi:alginate O-acetyltransferase complex protein AlgI